MSWKSLLYTCQKRVSDKEAYGGANAGVGAQLPAR